MAIVLAHVIQIECQVFVERMTDTGRKPIARPDMQTPVVENFVRNKPGERFFVYREWVFNLQAISVAPGVDLRGAFAPLKPIAFCQREFMDWETNRRAES